MTSPALPPLWRQREFMLLWGGMTVSVLGSSAAGIVYPLLILALTQSPEAVGVASALRVLPYLLLSLPVGAWVDRWDRRRVMLRCNLALAVVVGTLPVAMAFGHTHVWHIYAVALAEGTLVVFYNLAEVAALPRVVAAEQLPQSTAQNHAGHAGATVLGPAIGTGLFHLWRGLPFVADALSYLFSAWTLWRLRTDFTPRPTGPRRHLRAEVAEGLRWLWDQELVRHMALLTSGLNFVQAAVPLLLIVVAKQQGASEAEIGVIFSFAGVGGVLGAMVGSNIQRRFSFGQVIIGTVTAQALAFPLYAVCPGPLWLGVVYGVIMFFGPLYNVVQLSYRVSLIPDGLQGRVNSGFRLAANLLNPVGAVLCGVLIERWGTWPALFVFATVFGALAVVTWADRAIRQAPRYDAQARRT